MDHWITGLVWSGSEEIEKKNWKEIIVIIRISIINDY